MSISWIILDQRHEYIYIPIFCSRQDRRSKKPAQATVPLKDLFPAYQLFHRTKTIYVLIFILVPFLCYKAVKTFTLDHYLLIYPYINFTFVQCSTANAVLAGGNPMLWTSYLYRHQSKMLSSKKNIPVKGLCGRCLSEFILAIQSVMLVFSVQLCELLPL